jgi:hypothetical protein
MDQHKHARVPGTAHRKDPLYKGIWIRNEKPSKAKTLGIHQAIFLSFIISLYDRKKSIIVCDYLLN